MQISKVILVKMVEAKGVRSGAEDCTVFMAGRNVNGGPTVSIEPHALGVRVSYELDGELRALIIPTSNIAAIYEGLAKAEREVVVAVPKGKREATKSA